MNNLYDALEICLQEIENGKGVDAALLRYPDLADELRPILEASENARKMFAPEPSTDVVRRNRAKILQHAAEVREAKAKPVVRLNWFAPLRRLASMLAVLILVFASGTSLVGAAATSLPGENMYSVKRSWENLQLFFTFNAEVREALKVEHENERIEELHELLAIKRSASVTFSGRVTRLSGTEWLVAGIRVVLSPQTDLPSQVQIDSAVRVQGRTLADGSVLAMSIELLPAGASLPEVEDESDETEDEQDEDASGSGSDEDAPQVATKIPRSDDVTFDGILDVLNVDFWTINGVPADVSDAEIVGTPAVGAAVIVEGYFNSDGLFIVTKIEFLEQDPNLNLNSNSNSNDSGNGNQGDPGGGNDKDNSNDDDNANDNDDDDGDDDN